MAQPAPRRAPRSGGLYLFLLVVIGGAFAAFALLPKQVREAFGVRDTSRLEPGVLNLPARQGEVSTANRQTEIKPRVLAIDAQFAVKAAAKPVDTKTPTEVSTGAKAGPKDQGQAERILAEAEKLYRAYRWEEAMSMVPNLLTLEAKPETRLRAKQISIYAKALKDLFHRLDIRDELQRNVKTHPLLVSFTMGGEAVKAVPILDFKAAVATPPQTDDPIRWMQQQFADKGEVSVLMENEIRSTVQKGQISDLRPGDLERIMQEARDTFRSRLERMCSIKANEKDALAWYGAGKFAFRHRLDDQVVLMLEKAIALDPLLPSTIKEDQAQEIFLKVVDEMEKKQNRAAATGWMLKLKSTYADTSVFAQAQAYYENNVQALRSAREQALAARQKKFEETKQERVRMAKAMEDEQAATTIAAEKVAVREEEAPAEVSKTPLTGDAGKATDLFNQGMEIYTKAVNMPVCKERDQTYAKAEPMLRQARDLFDKLGMEAESTRAGMYLFAIIKAKRF